ncbi:MAG: LuxR C-terminal-related transcriptional regulator, partial [Ktedonobacterales bacterium]
MHHIRTPASETVSQREQDVLTLIAAGGTNREVAARLFVSATKIKTHLLHIYEKLGVSDRAAAVGEAYRRGILKRSHWNTQFPDSSVPARIKWKRDTRPRGDEDIRAELPPEVIASGWLGSPGATETELQQLEERLGTCLPPSYRQFLQFTNGWRDTGHFIPTIWSTEE